MKTLDEDEVVPTVDNEVPKNPPKKQKKEVYGPATHQNPRKRVKQNACNPKESTDAEENILDYSSDDNLECSGKDDAESEKLELDKELWKDKGKSNVICNHCSVINHEHTMARIVSARQ